MQRSCSPAQVVVILLVCIGLRAGNPDSTPPLNDRLSAVQKFCLGGQHENALTLRSMEGHQKCCLRNARVRARPRGTSSGNCVPIGVPALVQLPAQYAYSEGLYLGPGCFWWPPGCGSQFLRPGSPRFSLVTESPPGCSWSPPGCAVSRERQVLHS